MSIDMEAVWEYAVELHGSQKDKSGKPYWTHLAAVWQGVIELGGDECVQAAAILHDSVEDTDVDLEDLEAILPKRVTVAIEAVTKRKSEHNPTYVGRVIAAGKDAMTVKLSDLYHNTDPARLSTLTEYTQRRLKAKYFDAIMRLEKELGVTPTITQEQRDAAVKDNYGQVGSSGASWDEDWRAYSYRGHTQFGLPYEPFSGKQSEYPKPAAATAPLLQKPAKQLKVGDACVGFGEISAMRRLPNGTHVITFVKDGKGIDVTCGETRMFYIDDDAYDALRARGGV